MVVNEPRKGRAVLAIASRVAAPLIPLLVGAAGVAVLLDSGPAGLPPGAPGLSVPPSLPHESVVVAPQSSHRKASHTRSSRPAQRAGTRGRPAQSSGTPKTSPVSRPVNHRRSGGKPPSKPPSQGGGGSGSGGSGSGGSDSGGTGSSGSTPPPTQQPQTITLRTNCTHPRGLALGHSKLSRGKALGHGRQSCANRTAVPPGLALGHRNHVPPGQARKAQKHAEDGERGDESSSSHVNDNGHSNGKGHSNGNGHSSHGRSNGN